MKLNTKGFTLVEGLLIVIALCLIVGVGYFVYDKQSNKDNDTNTSTTQPASPAAKKEEKAIPQDWVTYTDKEKSFSFAYPSEWGDVTIKSLESSHEGEGYGVTFTKSDIRGMITNQAYKYTGVGRGGAYWEISGNSYAVNSQNIIDSAEKAKTDNNYSTLILTQDKTYILSAFNECMSGGLVTNLLTKVNAKQEYVFSLSKLKESETCTAKVDPSMADQSIVNAFKQIPGTIKSL